MKTQNDKPRIESTQSQLEMMLIDEFLKERGYGSVKELCGLPENKAKQLMIDACKYASARLAEIESRAKFQQKIHYKD